MIKEKAKLIDLIARFIAMTAKILPDDVSEKLKELKNRETVPLAKAVYDSMFENQEKALKLNRPSCQDTGVVNFFIRAGASFPYLGALNEVLTEAVRKATVIAPLRHNTVAIFEEKNDGTNVGERAPFINWEIVQDRDDIELYSYMAGGGCSLPGRAITLMPSAGYEGIVKYVFDMMVDWGINACPPLLVGIGIAGSADVASVLSKWALLRPIGSRNPNPKGAEMEKLLEEGLNKIGVGPQGLSGSSSVMGVHIETAARHPSTISVGINVGCWSHRKGCIRIKRDFSYEIISHKGVSL
ncbi:MAG: L(+)-tartrate dehydratase subunit alpha [Spirochaetes bacterium]|nr:L(+)-tartrate dehydratase subunit alpha [Spirochaetota bacterium]